MGKRGWPSAVGGEKKSTGGSFFFKDVVYMQTFFYIFIASNIGRRILIRRKSFLIRLLGFSDENTTRTV